MEVTYGTEVRWRNRDGSSEAVYVRSASRKQATQDALRIARKSGWTPPQWWQWWRWNDINYEKLDR